MNVLLLNNFRHTSIVSGQNWLNQETDQGTEFFVNYLKRLLPQVIGTATGFHDTFYTKKERKEKTKQKLYIVLQLQIHFPLT